MATGRAGFSASDRGILVHHAGIPESAVLANRQMVWMDRTNKSSVSFGEPTSSTVVKLALDGKRVALQEDAGSGNNDIWVHNLEQSVTSRLTTDPANDASPIWSPDGSQIVFFSNRGTEGDALYIKGANGALPEQLLFKPGLGANIAPMDWSLDGQMILFRRSKDGVSDLWVLPLSGDRKPFPYLVNPFNKGDAVFAPNGRWVAYASTESGSAQVFVQSFPDGSKGKWQISMRGGAAPRWKRDGQELYYLDQRGRIVAVPVKTEANFEFGQATVLFEASVASPVNPVGPAGRVYDVSADGQRFLVSIPMNRTSTVPAPPLTVTLNWSAALAK
jgi:Tol biopolymer transport system component